MEFGYVRDSYKDSKLWSDGRIQKVKIMEVLSWDAWVKGEVIGGKKFRER